LSKILNQAKDTLKIKKFSNYHEGML